MKENKWIKKDKKIKMKFKINKQQKNYVFKKREKTLRKTIRNKKL